MRLAARAASAGDWLASFMKALRGMTSVSTMVIALTVTRRGLSTTSDTTEITATVVIGQTVMYFGLTIEDLCGSSRSRVLVTARQIAMYLCRELTNLSLPKIGQLFGGRDHTTVMYANKKISELMKERRSIYNQVTELTSRIKQNHRYGK